MTRSKYARSNHLNKMIKGYENSKLTGNVKLSNVHITKGNYLKCLLTVTISTLSSLLPFRRAVVKFSNPKGQIVIDCLFTFLFSLLNPRITRGPKNPQPYSLTTALFRDIDFVISGVFSIPSFFYLFSRFHQKSFSNVIVEFWEL